MGKPDSGSSGSEVPSDSLTPFAKLLKRILAVSSDDIKPRGIGGRIVRKKRARKKR